MRSLLVASCILMLTVSISEASTQGLNADALRRLEVSLKSSRWALRPSAGTSRTCYVQTSVGECCFVYASAIPLPVRALEPVGIDRVSIQDGIVTIRIRSTRFGKGAVLFHPPLGQQLDLSSLSAMLTEVFADPLNYKLLAPVIGNAASHMVHVRGANHLPPPAERKAFESMEAAQRAGYAPCGVCFCARHRQVGYDLEMQLGRETAGQVRMFYHETPQDSLNRALDDVGRRVLARWPIAKRGYDSQQRCRTPLRVQAAPSS
jgi:hypothetical protein